MWMWFRLQMTPLMQCMTAFRDQQSGGHEEATVLTSARGEAEAGNLC